MGRKGSIPEQFSRKAGSHETSSRLDDCRHWHGGGVFARSRAECLEGGREGPPRGAKSQITPSVPGAATTGAIPGAAGAATSVPGAQGVTTSLPGTPGATTMVPGVKDITG